MADSPVINDSDDFVPMPTPDQVVEGDGARRLEPLPFEFSDIRALAQRILKRAQEQGMQKLEAARKQIGAMEKTAYDKGYADGFAKGQPDGFAKGETEGMTSSETKIAAAVESEKESLRQNAQPVTAILEQLAAVLQENRQQLVAQAEADLLLLALDIAKRLVGHELSVDPEAIRPLAVEAIGLVTDRSAVTVRVNPEDDRVMHDIIPELKTMFPDLGPVKIEADPSIERGGMMAATREAEVDIRLATRLAAFEEAILGFSGDAAVAPWSAIPPEAIKEYKRQNQESPYALPPAGEPEAEAEPDAPRPDILPTEAPADAAPDAQSPETQEAPQPDGESAPETPPVDAVHSEGLEETDAPVPEEAEPASPEEQLPDAPEIGDSSPDTPQPGEQA